MDKTIIAPSVLSIDYSRTSEQLEELMKSKAKWLHFDVMDGHFVPNITFGQDIMRGMKEKTNLFIDVHLMISNPEYYAPIFIENGADLITFHFEVFNDVEKCKCLCNQIKAKNCKCGISIKPSTPIECIQPLLDVVDLVLVMSVEPGFGGQEFQEQSLQKIQWLAQHKKIERYSYLIEIDGGINEKTAKLAVKSGCEVLVAGSFIFKQNISEAVELLLCQK